MTPESMPALRQILLLNPNTSAATTEMMVAVARAALPADCCVAGATATRGVPMIVTPAELEASEEQVHRLWHSAGADWDGVIVSCFGDPGVQALEEKIARPVVGICAAAMLEAAHNGRRFGIATTTPDLQHVIHGHAHRLGFAAQYSGIRVTAGEPHALVQDHKRLHQAMAQAIQACIDEDAAEAVIIGGGPLGRIAQALQADFAVPLISPIAAAARQLQARTAAAAIAA
ncbi:aspartate/glutamate racemase family protein [Variovorax sp. HJSM1_2]|uniref:aspartate/glutamate racemase family protein n=1 Tax=Variovorax sp. HJSM1_2 TaxID=3366263 RepID=UPI003BE96C2E